MTRRGKRRARKQRRSGAMLRRSRVHPSPHNSPTGRTGAAHRKKRAGAHA